MALMEPVMATSTDETRDVLGKLLNLAKKVDTPAVTLTLEVPKTRGTAEPFYPQSLERGRRSTRAVLPAVAELYVKGVSTRDVEKGMPVSRLATAVLVEIDEAWAATTHGIRFGPMRRYNDTTVDAYVPGLPRVEP